MSRLTDLIAQTKAKDPALGAELEREFRALNSRRAFGLNFERHRPEAVELPQRTVRKGDKVRVLPPRGSTEKGDQRLWRVARIEKADGNRLAHLRLLADDEETATSAVEDLVVVAEFRDPIYPGFVSTGKVERGGDKPFHTVINAENYHALNALTFTHRGKVDVAYLDPPYNTGAKDWRYNNDYVEGDDLYRHSKWLAFMERRLALVAQLLNPANSALIVTIDEKEYLRLGLLLEQVFPQARMQMITSVINPSGSSRAGLFARSDEYVYVLLFGDARVMPTNDDMLNEASVSQRFDVRWDSLRRRGNASRRSRIPSLYYPLYFDRESGRFDHCGEMVPIGESDAEDKPGLVAVLPIATNGAEMTWNLSQDGFRDRLARGFIRYYQARSGEFVIRYIQEGTIRAIEAGEVVPDGTDEHGFPNWKFVAARRMTPMTTWKRSSHSASDYGTPMLTALLPGRPFPYPKSLYAVEDVLRFFVQDKPDACVLDCFAGSGTTAHAVMRLNRQDEGQRQAILVTNNEVSAEEQQVLRRSGLRQGDPEWEERGICDLITRPRVEAAITGRTHLGEPVVGEYRFSDEFPMAEGFDENAEFFTLTYESPLAIGHNRAFERIAPLLWLRASSRGARIEQVPTDGWAVVDTYGVLFDLDQAKPFCDAVVAAEATVAFVVTDDDRRFQAVVRRLPEGVEPVRLYESYLSNFRFVSGE